MLQADVDALKAEIKTEFPKFQLRYKRDSVLMRVLSVFAAKTFMSSLLTTIGQTVYLSSKWDTYSDAKKCELLRHERVHMRQMRSLTVPLFLFLYAFVFLPIGLAYFRATFEAEAYAESLAAAKEYGNDYNSPAKRTWFINHFTSADYGWMFPFKGWAGRRFDDVVRKLDA